MFILRHTITENPSKMGGRKCVNCFIKTANLGSFLEYRRKRLNRVISSNWDPSGAEAVLQSLGYCYIIAESHRQSSHVQYILHPLILLSALQPSARNLQPTKIYGAPTNRVSPVLSSEGFFIKITSIYRLVGPILLASTLCVYLNNQSILKAPSWNECPHQF